MTAPAGWYPDPTSPDRARYWDGLQWAAPQAARRRIWPYVVGGLAVLFILGTVALVALIAMFAPFLGDFFGIWQGVYCGETQSC